VYYDFKGLFIMKLKSYGHNQLKRMRYHERMPSNGLDILLTKSANHKHSIDDILTGTLPF